MRAGKDSLAVPLMAKWENRKTLARAYGTSRHTSGWAGENVARSGGLIRAIRGQGKQASLEEPYLVTRCGLAWVKARLGAPGLGGFEKSGLFEHPEAILATGQSVRFQRRIVYRLSFSVAC